MLWATAANLVMRYGPLRQIWLCAMGHCGKFGYTLWATAADLGMCYGPIRGMKSYSKICDDFCAMGHSAGFGYALWAIAQGLVIRYGLAMDLVKRYGPWHSIWLYAMGNSEKPITIAQNYAMVFKSLPYPLKGQ